MDRMDEELRNVMGRASHSPVLTERDELLSALVSRIDADGIDVADAPLPAQILEAIPNTTKTSTLPKPLARVAGIGIAGWIALAVGSAVAATIGTQIFHFNNPAPTPSPSVTAPVPEFARADGIPSLRAPSTDELAAASTQQPDSDAPANQPKVLAVVDGDQERELNGPELAPKSNRLDRDDNGVALIPGERQVDGGSPPSLGDATEELTQAVEDLLPEGTLKDTVEPVLDSVAPIVESLHVDGILAGVVNTLLCGANPGVTVNAHDNVGITSISLRVTTGTGYSTSVPLAKSGTHTWSGVLAPLSLENLPALNKVVRVSVEVSDAAGNTTTATTNVTATIGSCLN